MTDKTFNTIEEAQEELNILMNDLSEARGKLDDKQDEKEAEVFDLMGEVLGMIESELLKIKKKGLDSHASV